MSADNPKLTDDFARVGLVCGRFRHMDASATIAAVATADGGVERLTYGDLRELLSAAFSAGDRLQLIASQHHRERAGRRCVECGRVWPCTTRLAADGTWIEGEGT